MLWGTGRGNTKIKKTLKLDGINKFKYIEKGQTEECLPD